MVEMRPTNMALMRLHRRAEAGDDPTLVETFVDVGPLFTLLHSEDHQIVAGRRGTGKTHALTYLKARVEERGDCAAFVDLRRIGSTGGVYADSSTPIAERGTRLLADVLARFHDSLVDYALAEAEVTDFTSVLTLLDRLADAITQVEVVGEHEHEYTRTDQQESKSGGRFGAKATGSGPSLEASLEGSTGASSSDQVRARVQGAAQHRVHFGEVSNVLERLVATLPGDRVWILLDEWSAIPLELQPLVADLIRRALFPVRGMVVKITAIMQRSNFRIARGPGDYLGIEVGGDAAADIDLDDFMVFGNDPEQAKTFFRELLFRHVRAQMSEDGETPPADADEFQREAFTQRNALDEFVRAR